MGTKVNDYSIGDSNIQSLMLTADKIFKGLHRVSLTNYDTTSESQIAAGSVVECGGALYKFDSNETITGSPSDGTVYIQIVPGLTTCTAVYTNTAPTWNDGYQGFYGTGGSAGYRYLEFKITKATAAYTNKSRLNFKDSAENIRETDGNKNVKCLIKAFTGWNMDTTQTLDISLSTITATKIMTVDAYIYYTVTDIYYNLTASGYTQINVAGGGVSLVRINSGLFDAAAFNNARGHIMVWYYE